MHRVRGLRAIIAAFLALPFGVMDVRGQQEGFSLELRELRPEWAELIISHPPGTNVAIEISEDLTSWKSHLNVETTFENLSVYDRDVVGVSGGPRFYRVRVPGLSVEEAQATWEQHGMDSYSYHFRRVCFCVPWTPIAADVTVRNGQVLSVTNVAYVPSPDPSEEPPPQPDLSWFRTIDAWFALIGDATQHADSVVVSYDPVWGFPRRIAIDEVVEFVDDEDEYWVERLTPENPDGQGFAR